MTVLLKIGRGAAECLAKYFGQKSWTVSISKMLPQITMLRRFVLPLFPLCLLSNSALGQVNSSSPAFNPQLTNVVPNGAGPVLYYNGSGPVPSYNQTSPDPAPLPALR